MFILSLESHLLRGDRHLDLTVVSFTSSRSQASLISASCPSAWLTLWPLPQQSFHFCKLCNHRPHFFTRYLAPAPWSSPAPAYICRSTVLTLSHTHSPFSCPSLLGLYIPDQTLTGLKSVTLVSASLYVLSRVTRSSAQASTLPPSLPHPFSALPIWILDNRINWLPQQQPFMQCWGCTHLAKRELTSFHSEAGLSYSTLLCLQGLWW